MKLTKHQRQGIANANEHLDSLLSDVPPELTGDELVDAIMGILTEGTSTPMTQSEMALIALGGTAIARLIELERGERSFRA